MGIVISIHISARRRTCFLIIFFIFRRYFNSHPLAGMNTDDKQLSVTNILFQFTSSCGDERVLAHSVRHHKYFNSRLRKETNRITLLYSLDCFPFQLTSPQGDELIVAHKSLICNRISTHVSVRRRTLANHIFFT